MFDRLYNYVGFKGTFFNRFYNYVGFKGTCSIGFTIMLVLRGLVQ